MWKRPTTAAETEDHDSVMYAAKSHACALEHTCSHADTFERHVKHRWELAALKGIREKKKAGKKAGGGRALSGEVGLF